MGEPVFGNQYSVISNEKQETSNETQITSNKINHKQTAEISVNKQFISSSAS